MATHRKKKGNVIERLHGISADSPHDVLGDLTREHREEIERDEAEVTRWRQEERQRARESAQYATVGSKGQIVIPARIRRQLGIKPGHRVKIEVYDGRAVLKPVPENILDLWHGRYANSPHDLLGALRRDHEEEIAHDERRNLRRARPIGVDSGGAGG